jgi:4-amino-4-deoxy-L-arabinose transferase-like glycosyltransferase
MRLDEGSAEEGFVGLRAVGHVDQSRDVTSKSFTIDADTAVVVSFAIATFVLHFAVAGGYGYQRDELYFISCARHLAWGYVDQPPLIALIAKIALALFGDSLYGIRFLPAVAAAATVVVTGRIARRLGGGIFAQSIAMLGIALAPFFLAIGNLLTMNAFEPLLWVGSAYLFLKAHENDRLSTWCALGVVSGLGLVNKYSMFFFLGSCFVAIVLSPERRSLLRPGFALAVTIAAAFVAPTLVWQAQHGWPQLEVLHNAAVDKNVVVGPLAFYSQQILMMNPLAAPIWIVGLWSLLFARGGRPLRWYGYAYLLLSVTYLALGAKVYYLAPIYPVLFAAGAAMLEEVAGSVRPIVFAYPALLLVGGLAIAPEAFPLLPLHQFLKYETVLDFRGIKMEKHPEGLVPQHFADMLGWHRLVTTIAAAYDALGPRYHLPHAISGHNNYYLYGPGVASGKMVLAIGFDATFLHGEFRSVRQVAVYRDAYVLPDFNNLPIYACSDPIRPLAAWWPATKRFV